MSDVREDISEKFGVSWLAGPAPADAPRPEVATQAATSDATLAIVGKQILGVLKDSPDQTGRVHEMVDRLKLDISTILSVVDWLEAARFVTLTKEQYGNHTLKLTEAGQAWMS